MKKLLLIIILATLTTILSAQEQKKYYLGGSFSYGKTNYSSSRFNFSKEENYTGNDYYSIALDYAYRTSSKTDFFIGLSATLHRLNTESSTHPVSGFSNSSEYYEPFGIFSVPLGIKYHFGKYFYAKGGASLNYHPYKGYTWGIGGLAGLGAEYTLKSGLSLSISPQIQFNMLGLGSSESTNSNFDENLTQIGVNIGIGYRF